MSSSFEEALLRDSGPVLAAAKAARLPQQEQDQVNGLVFLVSKHKELKAMKGDAGFKAFQKLDRDVQEALKANFGDEDYLQGDTGVLGGAWRYVRDFGESVLDTAQNYAELITTPYRAARIAGSQDGFFSKKTWKIARDGNRIFDADREQAIDQFYAPSVRKLAKRLAMGESFSEILSSLETEEEFATFQKYTNGDEEVQRAVKDYDMAKISIGRDIAKVFFDVKVGEFGVERKAFDLVSGSLDAVSQVAYDPLTYVAAPFKAMQAAKFGTVKLLELKPGTAQYINKVDDLFARDDVRTFWDKFGEIAMRTLSEDKATRRQAWAEIRKYASDFDPASIQMIRDTIVKDMKLGVVNADTAKQFILDGERVADIMKGSVGTMQRMLPRHTFTREVRGKLSNITNKLTGYNKIVSTQEDTIDDFLDTLVKNGEIKNIQEVRQMRSRADRVSRTFENALLDNKIFIGGTDEAGRSLRAQSAKSVYQIARSVGLSRFHSSSIADVYANTDHQGALNILYGLYGAAGDVTGATRTAAGQRELTKMLQPFKRQKYLEDIKLDAVDRQLLNVGDEVEYLDVTQINGNSRGIYDFHISDQINLPDINKVMSIGNNKKYSLLRTLNGTFNNRVSQSATNYWSALTLLPRLGLRTTIEENLFHAITIPGEIARNLLIGRKASTLIRQLEGDKQLGIPTRVLRKVIGSVSPEERAKALENVDNLTDFLSERLARGAFRKTDDQTAKWIAQLAKTHGNREVQHMQDAVTNTAYADPTIIGEAVSRAEIPVDVKKASEELGIELTGEFADIRFNDLGFLLNFKTQFFNRIHNSKFGKLAVEYMDEPQVAVQKIKEAMLADPQYTAKFQKASSIDDFAKSQYIGIRNLFKTRNGDFNQELLDLTRTKTISDDGIESIVVNADIDIDVLDNMGSKLPAEVFGRVGKYVTEHTNRTGFVQEAMDVGFEVADRQVATLSREPVYYAYYVGFRKKLQNAEDAFRAKLAKENPDLSEKQIDYIAGKRYTALASEMAYNRILGYIDNPLQRSNLAFANRNSARYYRATEDFYRRVGRTVVNAPDAFVRLRMTSEGLDHAGFIHEDQNGERYFFMPVDSVMYAAYAPIVKAITGEWPKKPMPVRLSGKIKMLSPSLDPESALPSFSGPLMAIAAGTVERMLPIEMREGFTRTLLGPYAENSSLYQQLMPGTVRRAIEVAKAMDPVGTSEQVHSAAMKAAAFYAANGMAPGADADLQEREEFSRMVQATARNIVAVRNILGIFSPVAPQIMTNADVPEHLLEAGTVSFKDEFNKLVSAEINKGNNNAYDDALLKWTKLRPGALVYTVSETEMNKIATVRKTRQAAEWVKQNANLLKKHPQGAAFLIPAAGEFDIEAYSFLKREGFIQSRPLDEYFREVSVIQAENEYYDKRKEHEMRLTQVYSDDARAIERRRWTNWSKDFKEANPYLRLELENYTGLQVKRDALDDLRQMIATGAAPANETTRVLGNMIEIYDNAEALLSRVTGRSDAESRYRESVRKNALVKLEEIAATNPNASVLLNNVLNRLLGE